MTNEAATPESVAEAATGVIDRLRRAAAPVNDAVAMGGVITVPDIGAMPENNPAPTKGVRRVPRTTEEAIPARVSAPDATNGLKSVVKNPAPVLGVIVVLAIDHPDRGMRSQIASVNPIPYVE